MPVRVVDASALAALLFDELARPEVAARLEGATLVAPALLPFELANACLKKIRRHPEARDSLLRGLRHIAHWLAETLPGELITLDRWLAAARAR